ALTTVPAGMVVPVGPGAEGVAVDPTTGVVAVGRTGGAVLFDETGRSLASVSLDSGPRHVALVAPGGPFIVPEEGSRRIALVDEPSGTVSALIPTGRNPHDVAVVGDRIFIGNEGSNTVTVVHQGTVIATLPAVTQPGGLAAIGSAVAVVGVRSRRLELIDAASLRSVASAPVEKGPSHVAAAVNRLYVVDTGGTQVRVFATRPRLRQIANVDVPRSPLGMAMDARQNRLWITSTATNQLVELAVAGNSMRIVGTFPTVRQPNTVAVDQVDGTVFVIGERPGLMQIIKPPSNSSQPR
ncbi:MAG: YncE family protein, partial [Mycobacterium sp.]